MPSTSHRGRPAGGPLTSVFSSSTLPELIAIVDRLGSQSIADLAERAAVSRQTVSAEVRKLVELGIVTVEQDGNRRIVRLAATPAAQTVRALAAIACDVPHAIRAEFAEITGTQRVIIFGSWAARNAGEPGRLPNDIDVLVVGSTDPDDVYEAAERATRRIGILVSARRVPSEAWEDPSDPFLKSLLSKPLIEVTG